MQAELAAAANEALERFRDESRKTTLRLVEMESSYLTVDFFRKLPQEVEKGGNPAAPANDRYSDGHFRRIGSNVSSYVGMVSENLRNTIPKAVVHCQVREAKRSLLDHFYAQVGKREVRSLITTMSILSFSFSFGFLNADFICLFSVQGKQLVQLLDEDPALMERRVQCAKRLELYKSARDEIDSVAWAR